MTPLLPLHRALRLLLLGSAFASPVAAQRTPGSVDLAMPTRLVAASYEVVLLTSASAATLEIDSLFAAYFGACRTRLGIPPADSVAVVRSRPWDWTAGGTSDPSTLTLLVSRTGDADVPCAAGPSGRVHGRLDVLAAARGYRVTADTAYPVDAAITAVRLHRGGRSIDPVDEERAAATRLTTRGIMTVSNGLLRLSVPLDAAAPDSSGEVSDLILEVIAPDPARSARITIPWRQLRVIWNQALAARSRRSASLETAAAPPLARLARTAEDPARLHARVQLGSSFAAAGDLAAARVVLGDAVQSEPCLTLHASAGEARQVLRALRRPADRCVANMPLTLTKAVLLPGFGHTRGVGRQLYAGAVFGLVAGSLVASQRKNDDAKQYYARYLAVDGPDPVLTANTAAYYYGRAEDARMAGTSLVAIGATAWVVSILEAAWTERRQEQRLRRVRDLRPGAPAVGIAPHAAPDRIGLAIRFF